MRPEFAESQFREGILNACKVRSRWSRLCVVIVGDVGDAMFAADAK